MSYKYCIVIVAQYIDLFSAHLFWPCTCIIIIFTGVNTQKFQLSAFYHTTEYIYLTNLLDDSNHNYQ
jgi:hypothetical protein